MPEVQQVQPVQPKKRRVWPWVFFGIVVLIIVIVGGDWGIRKYNRYRLDVKICKERCAYNTHTKVWQYAGGFEGFMAIKEGRTFTGRSFVTQKQCIDYCLSK